MTGEADSLRIERLHGADIAARLAELARLRITVFREWPYLYEGSPDYEQRYLKPYLSCAGSLAVLVWDGARCIGASTALPLAAADPQIQQPFLDQGHDIAAIDYFGESVLLPPYRGRGLGVRFFAEREAHARSLGLGHCAFCAVERPAHHPRRPDGYRGNERFWQHRGYRPVVPLRTRMSWPDIGEAETTPKTMQFWMRDLSAPP